MAVVVGGPASSLALPTLLRRSLFDDYYSASPANYHQKVSGVNGSATSD